MSRRRPLLWFRNPKKLSAFFQIVALFLVGAVVSIMSINAAENMAARGLQLNTWFLNTEAAFKVGFAPFWDFVLGESKYWEVFVIGTQNTLLVGLAGLVGATLLGFTVGVARLSNNWFVKSFAGLFVEIFRNVPLLLQVFFWNFVVILSLLPSVRDAISLAGSIFISNKGIFLPVFSITAAWAYLVYCVAVFCAVCAIFVLRRWNKRRFRETGRNLPVFWLSLCIVLGATLLAWLLSASATEISLPERTRFSFKGGFQVPIPLFSLWVALVCYTGAFIAENVRAGILSVDRGQREAAMALGFHRPLSMRLVEIPQALRVIIPPTISQYLNLMKNSSLAVAIGYDDLVNLWMGITLNQTGQAIVIIAMTMGVYTAISLLTSLILNIYNRRTQLVER